MRGPEGVGGEAAVGLLSTSPAGTIDVARSTATITILTFASRITGFVRIAVVTAVLGDTFLGNTYESANTVPNLVFELVVAGVLQATLIPTIVELLSRGDDREAEHVSRSVLGLAGAALATLAAVGMLAAPWVMRLLLLGVDDAGVRAAEVRLGTVFLWCFLPQVVFYASHMVATASLNARGHFAAPAVAPLANNVVVTLSYLAFWSMRDGAPPSLALTVAEKLVLGLGTTLGVLAFCAVPVVAAVRTGISMSPLFDARHPKVRVIARRGLWAALFLAATQVLQVVVLVLANRVEGGVVAWTLAFTLFFLPHSLVSLPVLTALYPEMSRRAVTGDDAGYGRTVSAGLRSIAFLVMPATAAMVALARPLADLLRLGAFSDSGANQVAAAVAAFGPGLIGYGSFLFLARSLYARGDTRTPAMVNLAVVAGGSLTMAAAFGVLHGDARVAGLAAGHSATYLVGAVVLYAFVRDRSSAVPGRPIAAAIARATIAAGAAGVVMWLCRLPFHSDARIGAAVELAVAGTVGLFAYVVVSSLVGGPRPGQVPAMLRGHDG